MDNIRRLLGFLMALAFAVVAMPAQAQPSKLYSLHMSPPNVASGDNVKLTAKFTNVSPGGGANSSFNALQLNSPSDYTITKVLSVKRENGVSQGIPTYSANRIRVEGLSSVGKNQFVTIEFEATVPANCTTSRWNPDLTGDVWTGSQVGSGQTFQLVENSSALTTTTSAGSNSVAFSTFPTSIAVNVGFSVAVTETKSCATAPFSSVALTGPSGFTAGTQSSTTSGQTQTTTIADNVFNPAAIPTTLVLTASAGSASASVTLAVYADGVIDCGDPVPLTDTSPNVGNNPLEPGYAASVRERWNSDGAVCELVPYDFQNAILTSGQVALKWPTDGTQRGAVFRTSANSALKTLPATTTYPTPGQPLYGWELNASGYPLALTPGLMCLDSQAPKPYAKLAAPLAAGYTGEIEVSFGDAIPGGYRSLPAAGVEFDFTVLSEGAGVLAERIRAKVVSVNGTTATLQIVGPRGRGTTPDAAHATDRYLMSVVMPVDGRANTAVHDYVVGGAPTPRADTTNPYYNKVVRMCTIAQGLQIYKPDALGISKYYEFLEYFDGDGFGVFR